MRAWLLTLGWLAVGAEASAAGDAAEISRSRGKKGGAVVLWPRLVPESADPVLADQAARVQALLAQAVGQQAPAVDVRPAPERVCPLIGCRAASVGLLLGHQDGGCVAVAVVGPPGPEAQTLVPLAGSVEMVDPALPFRAAPEGKLIVREFVPCTELADRVAQSPELGRLWTPPPAP